MRHPKLDQAQARMLKTFREAGARLGLFGPSARILAAVSGGGDSMALLHLLAEHLPPGRLAVAHVNHRTRGKASDRDEALVRRTARSLGLACLVARLPRTKLRPSEDGLRNARYRALGGSLAKRFRASHIALAHTADDQAETILLRLVRGTGLGGLSGIPETRPLGKIGLARPLLKIPKAELIRYLDRHHIRFAEDASNRDLTYARNRIRHKVLPELKRLNPRTTEALLRLSSQAAEAEDFLKKASRREAGKLIRRRGRSVRVDLKGMQHLHPALRPLLWQEACGTPLEADHLKALETLRGETSLPDRFVVTVEAGFARIRVRKADASRGSRKG